MALNTFNVGRDGYTLTIFDASGGQISFNGITGFDEKPQYAALESTTIDGVTRHRDLPKGHTGTITLDRQDSGVQDYFAGKEADFFAGLPPDDIVITHTIQELNGTTSQYQYSMVSLSLTDAGSWKGLDKVTLTLAWKASLINKVS